MEEQAGLIGSQSDNGTLKASYRGVDFEVQALFSKDDVWTFTLNGPAIQTGSIRNAPTFPTSIEAIAMGVRMALVSLDEVLDRVESLIAQLGQGQPVDFAAAGEIGNIAANVAQGILSDGDLDQQSEYLQRFRLAFEQSTR